MAITRESNIRENIDIKQFYHHDTVHDIHSNMRRHKPVLYVKLFDGNFECAVSDKNQWTQKINHNSIEI